MEQKNHVCPVWAGYLLASPLRKLVESPRRILSPYIRPGMHILEIGPGMGFFSIPMAKMTGREGKVYCIDIQEKMLEKLKIRAIKKGADSVITTIQANRDSLNASHLSEKIDFILLAYVVHEIPDQNRLFSEIARIAKKDAKVLMMEPKGHVDRAQWEESLRIACKNGFAMNPHAHPQSNRVMELYRI